MPAIHRLRSDDRDINSETVATLRVMWD